MIGNKKPEQFFKIHIINHNNWYRNKEIMPVKTASCSMGIEGSDKWCPNVQKR